MIIPAFDFWWTRVLKNVAAFILALVGSSSPGRFLGWLRSDRRERLRDGALFVTLGLFLSIDKTEDGIGFGRGLPGLGWCSAPMSSISGDCFRRQSG
jgi:hypothetical protein